jgi:peptide/nickel transport system substrate-binding protein
VRSRLVAVAIALLLSGSAAAATLRVAIPNPPFSRGNPYQAPGPANTYVTPAIFDALTVIDGAGNLHPGLALEWSSDAEARVWVFKLRPGVTFSNGAPVNAAAVVRALAYLTGTPEPSDLVPLEFADVAGFRALDATTLEITTRRPMPLLPHAASVLFVVEPDTWERLGPQGFAGAPVGSGPFQVQRWARLGSPSRLSARVGALPRSTGSKSFFSRTRRPGCRVC